MLLIHYLRENKEVLVLQIYLSTKNLKLIAKRLKKIIIITKEINKQNLLMMDETCFNFFI